ncbi:MAG: sodium:proton antiporter NhaD [Candidatus Latescibacterota bacterium]|nr:sodium:proton antiporter NhaD [Candidatus Latescibacterota bacterium]
MKTFLLVLSVLFLPVTGWASGSSSETLDLTGHTVGILSLIIFSLAYLLVMSEEITHLRKSKPVLLAAGIIWAMIAAVYASHGMPHAAEVAIRHNFLEFSELMVFLLVAMSYVNAMEERRVFETLRSWLVRKGYGFRQLFWMTGILSFFISPIADNLTTALVMCAVVLTVGGDNKRFILLGCINIVVAANAGGAFSPFGDITTLMVWQKGVIDFGEFFVLFIPSVVNYVVPAAIMHFSIPNIQPEANNEIVIMKRGAKRIIVLFLATIATAVSYHNFLHLPPVIGMMTGFAYLQIFGFFLKKTHHQEIPETGKDGELKDRAPFNIFDQVARAEWDTLLFFYGVILAVGGLGFIGYLSGISEMMYTDWGPTNANIAVGVLSAIVDNIPVMFAVLSMNPEMSHGQWLLVTLTAGVGGSMLSIGSAAGVALMGQARGKYTFGGHLKWTPVIALGYAASIWIHLLVNARHF